MTGITTLLLALAQVAPPAVVVPPGVIAPQPPVAMPPADWSRLADLPLTRRLPPIAPLSGFVHDEVSAGRCAAATATAAGWALPVEMAVLVAADGAIRRIVPRAIDCVAVEQYAVGLVSRLTRGAIAPHDGADRWYRTTMVFTWTR